MRPSSEFLVEGVSSNWFNALNFVLFDLILLSCLFQLTADISGCLNERSIRNAHQCALYVTCPPLLGGGLSGTSPRRSTVLLFIRLLGLVLVLCSNFMVGGGSTMEKVPRNATVLSIGTLDGLDIEQTMRAHMRRMSCQGLTNTTVYFGELRNGTECELDRSVIAPPVEFSKYLTNVSFVVNDCNDTRISLWNQNRSHHVCSNTVMQCAIVRDSSVCQGVVHLSGNLSLVCPMNSLRKGANINTKCQKVWNIAYKSRGWLGGQRISFSNILDLIFASYGAGQQVQEVYVQREIPYTTINKYWLFFMFIKSTVLVSLLLYSLYLRIRGWRPRLNDEAAFLQLIESSSPSSLPDDLPEFVPASPRVYLRRFSRDGRVLVSRHRALHRRNAQLHDRELASC